MILKQQVTKHILFLPVISVLMKSLWTGGGSRGGLILANRLLMNYIRKIVMLICLPFFFLLLRNPSIEKLLSKDWKTSFLQWDQGTLVK